jgi:predicted PurR-regulated permease PerM
MEKRVFEISWSSLWKIFIFLIVGVVFYLSWKILLALFLAVVLSSGLDFFIDFLEKRGLPRILAVILVFVLAGLIVAVILYTVIPLVIIDLNNLSKNLSKYGFKNIFPLFNFKSSSSIIDFINKLSYQFWSGESYNIQLLTDLLGGATLTLFVIISSFYLCLTKNGVEKFIQAVFPANYETTALRIYERSKIKISRWFRAQILLSITIFIVVFIALTILNVKHAFLLSLLAGLLEIVPYVGPIIAGASATISALTTSFSLALITLIVFVLIQQTENHILVPLFMKKSIELHPVIVIGTLLIGGHFAGVLGMLVSLPIAVIIQEIIEEYISRPKSAKLI